MKGIASFISTNSAFAELLNHKLFVYEFESESKNKNQRPLLDSLEATRNPQICSCAAVTINCTNLNSCCTISSSMSIKITCTINPLLADKWTILFKELLSSLAVQLEKCSTVNNLIILKKGIKTATPLTNITFIVKVTNLCSS